MAEIRDKSVESDNVNDLVTEIRHLYQEKSRNPFPYEGCGKLLEHESGRYTYLIPNLDFYLTTIAGYGSWGRRILEWPKEKLVEVREKLEQPFFEQYPEYRPLELMITEFDTPDLYADLALHEKMRINLLAVVSILLSRLDHPY